MRLCKASSTRFGRTAIVALLCTVLATRANATTVEPIDLSTAADLAAEVLVGRIGGIETRWAENPRRIESVLTFVDLSTMKGEASSGVVQLTVPGGSLDGFTFRIAGAPEFAVGETWLLFVLPTYKVHPVVGLNQGAFRVIADETGVPRVHDAGARPVLGLDAGNHVVTSDDANSVVAMGVPDRSAATPVYSDRARVTGAARWRSAMNLVDTSEGCAAHSTDEIGSSAHRVRSPAMELSEFVQRIRPIITNSRPHPGGQPAGSPDPRVLKAVPLRHYESPAATPGEGNAGATTPVRSPMTRPSPIRANGEGKP